ncbi:hypothetical protein SAMD00019534_122620 [Acytostelium subglobosum LB1]|uniref:hypothetical protein n=1 Tax=Acytostelium subglobosum LB1 TaxID=1410327 RepID=UPI000644CB78|nr:hypothetical protein SAMD00019534_122620 [Acytostelium subglobosum LB1]GAM29086.1 hypothetical protein SAMD00019534_122620 [Acytostelium subglobosum LB1]|eukprot:XP_012747931.1 hypothetical protein SAMD00019534_122620 [Acytostelium subglobosum LB1]
MVSSAGAMNIQSATIVQKSTNVLGVDMNFALIDIAFDSELYFNQVVTCPNFTCPAPPTIDCTCDYTDHNECPKKLNPSCPTCPTRTTIGSGQFYDRCNDTWTTIQANQTYRFDNVTQNMSFRYKANTKYCEGIRIYIGQDQGDVTLYEGTKGAETTLIARYTGLEMSDMLTVMDVCPSDNLPIYPFQSWTNGTFFFTVVPHSSMVSFSLTLYSGPVNKIDNSQPKCTQVLPTHQCINDGEQVKGVHNNMDSYTFYTFVVDKRMTLAIGVPYLNQSTMLYLSDENYLPSSNPGQFKWAISDTNGEVYTCNDWGDSSFSVLFPRLYNNPLWPVPVPLYSNPIFSDINFFSNLYFNEPINTPKSNSFQAAFLLSYSVYPSVKVISDFNKLLNSTLTFTNRLIDSNGNALEGPVRFQQGVIKCNYTDYQLILEDMKTKENKIFEETLYSNVSTLRYEIDAHTLRDPCSDPRYLSDPCCNTGLQFVQCCSERNVSVPTPIFLGVQTNAVQAQCSSVGCTSSILDEYFNALSSINRGECTIPQSDYKEFRLNIDRTLRSCKDVYSDVYCENDDMCNTNNATGVQRVSCNLYSRVCEPSRVSQDKAYLYCVLNESTPATLYFLKYQVGLGSVQNINTLVDQMYKLFLTDDCSTYTGLQYRKYSTYESSQIQDYCYPAPHCLDNTCLTVHDICYDGYFSGFGFYPEQATQTQCEQVSICPTCAPNNATCQAAACPNGNFCGYCPNNQTSCFKFPDLSGSSGALGPEDSPVNLCNLKGNECLTKDECDNVGVCSDSYFFQQANTINYPDGLGKCMFPRPLNMDPPTCKVNEQNDSPMGCYAHFPEVFNEAECTQQGGTWWTQSENNRTRCEEQMGCQVPDRSYAALANQYRFNEMNISQCTGCGVSDHQWTNKFTWTQARWMPGVMVKAQWIKGGAVKPTTWGPTFDFDRFAKAIQNAFYGRLVDLMRSSAMCRMNRLQENLDSIACSCSGPGGSQCFGSSAILLGTTTACAQSSSNFTFNIGQLLFTPQSVPLSCVSVLVSQISKQLYTSTATASLSSAFVSYKKPGSFAIFNDKGANIGTILNDGVKLQHQGVDSFTLCLLGGSTTSDFPILDFAQQSANDTKTLIPLGLQTFHLSVASGLNYLCANVTVNNTDSSTYFPIIRLSEWRTATKHLFDQTTTGLIYTLAVLFGVNAVWGFVQLVFVGYKLIHNSVRFKLVHGLLLAITTFITIRSIYFFMLPSGKLSNSLVADYILVVLPTFIYFTSFSIIVVLWYVIVSSKLHVKFFERFRQMIIVINVIIYIIFIIIVLVFNFSKKQPASECGARMTVIPSSTTPQRAVSIFYAVVQAVISLIIGSAFVYFGWSIYNLVGSKNQQTERQVKRTKYQKKIFLVASTCSVGFILHCIFVLILVGTEPSNIVFSFVGLIITEIIPVISILISYNQGHLGGMRRSTGSTNTSMQNMSGNNSTRGGSTTTNNNRSEDSSTF